MKEKFSIYLPGILLFFAALVVGLLVYQGYGIAWDEPVQREMGVVGYNYIFHGDQAMYSSPDLDHGFGFELFLVIIEKWAKITDVRTMCLMRHLVTHVLFLISALSLYIIAFRLYKNQFLACLAFLLLVLSPRIYAHSFFNTKDMPFLSIFLIALLFAQLAFEKNKAWLFIILGLVTGYATSIRNLGIMLVGFILFFMFIDMLNDRKNKMAVRKHLFNAALFIVGFSLAVYAWWPYLWKNPVGNFLKTFQSFSHYQWDGPCLLGGEVYHGMALPWFYFPYWFFITTPVLWLITGCAGILLLIKDLIKKPLAFLKNTPERNFILYLLCFFVPVLAVIVLHSVIYNDWRHLYFVFPSFILIAIYFLNKILHKIPGKYKLIVPSLCLLQILSTAVFMVKYHPYQQVYFNELVSHEPESLRENYEIEYWGCSYKQGLEYLLAHVKADTIRVCDYYPERLDLPPIPYNMMILREKDRKRILLTDPSKADYFLTNFLKHQEDYPIPDIEYSIKVLNSTILRIYKLNNNNYMNAARHYLQSKQFDSAIIYFSKIPVSDANFRVAQSSIAEIYANKQNFDSAEVYLIRVITLMPDNADVINNLGCMYMANKKYPLAIEQLKKSISLNPKNINAYSNLGRSYFFSGKYQDAMAVFRQERALNPNYNNDIPYMGMIFQKSGNMDSVLKYKAMIK